MFKKLTMLNTPESIQNLASVADGDTVENTLQRAHRLAVVGSFFFLASTSICLQACHQTGSPWHLWLAAWCVFLARTRSPYRFPLTPSLLTQAGSGGPMLVWFYFLLLRPSKADNCLCPLAASAKRFRAGLKAPKPLLGATSGTTRPPPPPHPTPHHTCRANKFELAMSSLPVHSTPRSIPTRLRTKLPC